VCLWQASQPHNKSEQQAILQLISQSVHQVGLSNCAPWRYDQLTIVDLPKVRYTEANLVSSSFFPLHCICLPSGRHKHVIEETIDEKVESARWLSGS